jgi:regulator of sigma D
MEDTIVEYLKYITKRDSIKVENRQINVNLELDVDNFDIRIMIDNTEISEYEFDILREIILEQNGLSIEYINQYHPELEQKLAQSMSFNNLTFEDEIFTFSILMRKSLDEIGDYTSYQLKNLMERMFVLKQFDLYKPLEVSGQIKMQGGSEIKPYLYHEESKSRYGSILVDADKFMNANKDIFADN